MKTIAHQLSENIKLLQKAVVINAEGKVLLLQRSANQTNRPNLWDLPGGNSEWPHQQTEFSRGLHQIDLQREIKEETGLEISPSTLDISNLIYFDTTFQPDQEIFTVLCGWRIQLPTTPDLQLSLEHQKFQWIKPADVTNFEVGYAAFIYQMVKQASK